ncbi:Aminodeoxychorismate lyase [Cladophialophora chaetospira]|uniref:Aminodeoxychorismate lyase n=1 Tax=Cladophialophora chaetospira TaxID=386627 RepID=A0AA38WZ59_9EURO|nr:Aminodeoxychorismate lyase [Cladophialophora chaetospira]
MSLSGVNGATPSDSSQEQDPMSAKSTADLHIVTSLMYHYFNKDDNCDKTQANAEISHLISQWRELRSRLSDLHVRRLRDAAAAAGWENVAWKPRLSSEHRSHDQDQLLNDYEQKAFQLDLHLPFLLDKAAIRHVTDAKLPPPSPGTMRSHKVRILASRAGEIDVEFAPQSTSSEVMPSLSAIVDNYSSCPFTLNIGSRTTSLVTMDTEPTFPSLVTRHKTTIRDPYNAARARAVPHIPPTALPTEKEVLLFNAQDEIMEASVSSVYFHRQGRWVTPSTECGGMQSVTKMYAVEEGWCVEGVVSRDTITSGETVWLGNAVRGFFAGKIVI